MSVPDAERCRAAIVDEHVVARYSTRQCSRRGYPVLRLNGTVLLCKQHQRSKTRLSVWVYDKGKQEYVPEIRT